MTPRPALRFLAATLLLLVAAIVLLVKVTVDYFTNWRPLSSASGDNVYRYNGQLVGYPNYVVGQEPALIAAALALLVVAVAIAALTWRPAP